MTVRDPSFAPPLALVPTEPRAGAATEATLQELKAEVVEATTTTSPVSGPLTDSQLRATAVPTTSTETRPGTATQTGPATSTVSATILAANTSRRGATIYNDSAADLYVNFGAAATSTVFVNKIVAAGIWAIPFPAYTGAIHGILSAGTGNARVCELT